ncbi:MAG: HAD family phosphatase [Candidatus Binatia bacterium]|nr:HAD family phosphatase [Candidatus Binatia bacterium]
MDRAVIFDMDGVLVDSFAPHRDSWLRAAREAGVEMTPEQFATTFGRTSREIIRRFWGDGLDDDAMRAIDDHKEALYRDMVRDDFPTMDGAVELIDALRDAGFRIAIGSSGPPENIELSVECLDRADCFEAVVTGYDVTHGKPNPEVFRLAGERLGVPKERCVVIEDAVAGVAAANAAGMASIALTGTTTRDALASASLVVDSLRELSPAAISALLGDGAPA